MNSKGLHMVSFILLVVGGLNWLLAGLFTWDVGLLFGDAYNIVARLIYILVGLAALYELFTHKGYCKHCGTEAKPSLPPQSPPASGGPAM